MNELLGDRVRERRMQLRVAQEQADRARPEGMSSPGSYGSLRALTVGSEGGGTGTGTHSSASAKLLVDPRLVASLPGFEPPPPSRWKRPAGVAAVAIGAVALFALGQFVHWGPAGTSGNATAPSPAPAVTAPAAPAETVAAPAASTAAPATASPPAETAEERKEAPGRRNVVVVRKGSATAPRPNGPSVQPATSGAAPASASENTRPQNHDVATPNAWDPGSFGGRR
jgi:hypothetical protein